MISVIVPAYNEEAIIRKTLNSLASREGNFEVIVVDGQSTDHTCQHVTEMVTAFPRPIRLLSSAPGRALQMNAGARAAAGEILLFLHADVEMADGSLQSLEAAMADQGCVGGNFDLIFADETLVSHVFTWIYHVRRPFGIYYGDSGLFVRRQVFEAMGGYKPIPIMEDYEFVRRLERTGRTAFLRPPLKVSSRRWEVQGVIPALFSWVVIQTLFSLGYSPWRMANWYRPVRKPEMESDEQGDQTAIGDRQVAESIYTATHSHIK